MVIQAEHPEDRRFIRDDPDAFPPDLFYGFLERLELWIAEEIECESFAIYFRHEDEIAVSAGFVPMTAVMLVEFFKVGCRSESDKRFSHRLSTLS